MYAIHVIPSLLKEMEVEARGRGGGVAESATIS